MDYRSTKWTKDIDELLLFMRHIDIQFDWCALILNREVGKYVYNKNMCIGRHGRLVANGLRYTPDMEK